MKILFIFIMFLSVQVSANTEALDTKSKVQVVYEKWYYTRSNDVSYDQFLKNCKRNENLLEKNIDKEILAAEDLSLGDFLVNHELFNFRENSGGRNSTTYRGEVCVTNLSLEHEKLAVKENNSTLLIRLSKSKWVSACNKFVEENKLKSTLYQDTHIGWTLLQGRFCYVKSYQLIKK